MAKKSIHVSNLINNLIIKTNVPNSQFDLLKFQPLWGGLCWRKRTTSLPSLPSTALYQPLPFVFCLCIQLDLFEPLAFKDPNFSRGACKYKLIPLKRVQNYFKQYNGIKNIGAHLSEYEKGGNNAKLRGHFKSWSWMRLKWDWLQCARKSGRKKWNNSITSSRVKWRCQWRDPGQKYIAILTVSGNRIGHGISHAVFALPLSLWCQTTDQIY